MFSTRTMIALSWKHATMDQIADYRRCLAWRVRRCQGDRRWAFDGSPLTAPLCATSELFANTAYGLNSSPSGRIREIILARRPSHRNGTTRSRSVGAMFQLGDVRGRPLGPDGENEFAPAHVRREANPATHSTRIVREARRPQQLDTVPGYVIGYFVAKRGSPSVMSNHAALKSTKMRRCRRSPGSLG